MPVVRGLERFLRQRGLFRSDPLSVLSGSTLAVDAIDFFGKQSKALKQDPLHSCIGVGFGVNKNVDEDLANFTKAQVTPIFVWNGLVPAIQPSEQPPSDALAEKRHLAWKAYEAGTARTASHLFSQIETFLSPELQHSISAHLQEKKVAVFRAPYTAAAQVAYLQRGSPSHAHAAMGPLELLLFGVERLVTKIDFEAGRVEWISLQDTLDALELSHSQFVDMCLLAGYGRCRTLPMVEEGGRFRFETAYDLIGAHQSGVACITDLLANDEEAAPELMAMGYQAMFEQSKALIEQALVLAPGGVLVPLTPSLVPKTGPTTGTVELPAAVYPLLANGVLSKGLLDSLLAEQSVEGPPFVDFKEYPEALEAFLPIKQRTFQELATALSPLLGDRAFDVVNRVWCQWSNKAPLTVPAADRKDVPSLTYVGTPAFSAALEARLATVGQANLRDAGVLFPLRWAHALATAKDSAAAFKPVTDAKVTTPDEAVCWIILQALAALGLIGADGSIPADIAAMLAIAEAEQKETPAVAAAAAGAKRASELGLLYATVLLRSAQVHGLRLSLLAPDGTIVVTGASGGEDERPIRLVSRLCSLFGLTCKPEAWTGAVDRDMAAFGSVVHALQRTLRHLVEAITASAVLRGVIDTSKWTPGDFQRLAAGLPFATQPSQAGGLVARSALSGRALAEAEAAFPQALAIRQDVARFRQLLHQLDPMLKAPSASADLAAALPDWTAGLELLDQAADSL